MASASQTIDIDVPPRKVFAVVDDYARYPEFLPEVKAVRVGPRTGGAVDVVYTLDLKIKTMEFALRHVAHPDELRIEWKLLRGEFMRVNQGSWRLSDKSGGGTTATYTIELRLAAPAPEQLHKALAEQGLPGLLTNFKRRAEQLWRP